MQADWEAYGDNLGNWAATRHWRITVPKEARTSAALTSNWPGYFLQMTEAQQRHARSTTKPEHHIVGEEHGCATTVLRLKYSFDTKHSLQRHYICCTLSRMLTERSRRFHSKCSLNLEVCMGWWIDSPGEGSLIWILIPIE